MWPSTSSSLSAAALLVLGVVFPDAGHAEVRELSAAPCDDGAGTCYQLAVGCEGLADRFVRVRRLGSADSRGTVILTVGGFGDGRYDKLPARRKTQDELVAAGFEVFQVDWLGDDGWVTDAWGAGFPKVLCAYSDLVKWLVSERAANPEVVCAQGNSGGSLQNAYGLALYGLEDILDMVVLSSGPPVTRLDQFCFPERHKALRERPGESGAEKPMVATTGRKLVDRVMGWDGAGDYCKRVVKPAAEIVEALQRDSLVSPYADEARDFDYPATKLLFVESERDLAAAQGRIYFEAVKCEKQWHSFPGGEHQIDNTPEGSALIVKLFQAECKAH